jgi:hypothetical protein
MGGTADATWNRHLARRLSPHVLEVENATHGMYVPGPVINSITVLGEVVMAVETFPDAIGWPEQPTAMTFRRRSA